MFKHKLAKSYPCYAVKGCPNKAKIFNDKLNNHLLCCPAHRQTLFSLIPEDPKLKQMFSTVNAVLFKHTNIIAEYLYKYLNIKIIGIVKHSGSNVYLDFIFATSLFRYLTTEIRLFWFYDKLAHFQAPCIEELRINLKKLEVSKQNLRIIFEFMKDLILRFFIRPVFETEKQLIDTFRVSREYIQKKDYQWPVDRLYLELIKQMIGTNNLISIQNLELQSFTICQVVLTFNFDRVLCHIIEPSLINYVSPESKSMWLILRSYLKKTFKIRFSNFPHIDLLEYYHFTGFLLHRIGELKKSIKLLKRAKIMLKMKKREMNERKYKKKIQRIYFDLGSVYFDSGVFMRAWNYFIKHNKIDPERINTKTYFCLGYILIRRREFKKCLGYLKKKRDKLENEEYWELKANCYYGLNNFEKAIKINEKTMKHYRNSHIQKEFYSGYKYAKIRKINLSKIIQFYQGRCSEIIYRYRTSNEIETAYFYRNHILAAEYYLNIASCCEESGFDQEAALFIDKAFKIVKKNYTDNNSIYIEIIIRAASIHLNLSNLSKARIYLIILLSFKQENRLLMEPYYELEMLTGKYIFLTNPIDEAKHISYKFYEAARKKIKRYHGYNHPSMIYLNILIGKLYIFDDFSLFYKKLKDAHSIIKQLNSGINFHPFEYRMVYELAAGFFALRKFEETIRLIKRWFEERRKREKYFQSFIIEGIDLELFEMGKHKEYRRKAKKILSKIYIYKYCAETLKRIILSLSTRY